MAKYSKKAQEKIGEVMREFKKGELETSSGKKVTDRDQAVAIGISEAHQSGYKVPKKPDKKESSSKKSGKETSSKQKQSGKGKTDSKKSDKKGPSK
ncbi:DUF6496 domain-containing protein [Proteiniphilum sp. UBA5384]|uniref:DUF6496 domain-containing protein n=1 Tax=Proteiniphilum sp. UBA5384 TaxID=1947279 RepID=UPI0025CE14ED|nr:DUF6496 domain-containing protein [Proteiniphilum sp. UBA5384]